MTSAPDVSEGDEIAVHVEKSGGRGFSDTEWTDTGTVIEADEYEIRFEVEMDHDERTVGRLDYAPFLGPHYYRNDYGFGQAEWVKVNGEEVG